MKQEENILEQAVELLRAGKPVIFPTDTVYGLGVAVRFAESPEILYQLKQRDGRKPIAWLVEGKRSLERYGKEIPDYACQMAQEYWPGPLTLVVKASEEVPKAFQSPEGTIALRMPDSDLARVLIAKIGSPLATTSANISGGESPSTVQDIDPSLQEAVGCVLDDGSTGESVASTVVDCTGDQPRILREGQTRPTL